MNNLRLLQNWLKDNQIQGLVIPSTDDFLSEFTPEHSQRLLWATNYTGSMGMAIVLQDRAALFVDGRYIQKAQMDTQGQGIDVRLLTVFAAKPLSDPGVQAWLRDNVQPEQVLAVDPALHPHSDIVALINLSDNAQIDLKMLSVNPIDTLWEDRPSANLSSVYAYPLAYAGASFAEKRDAVCALLKQNNLDAYLVSDPEDIAWLLNIRADDWPIAPVCLSLLLLDASGSVHWFVEKERLADDLHKTLFKGLEGSRVIEVVTPSSLNKVLSSQLHGKSVGVNFARTSYKLTKLVLGAGESADEPNNIVNDNSLELMRWQKHPIEVQAVRRVHHIDGVAVIRFMAWLDQNIGQRTISEMDAAAQLTSFRKESPEYRGDSMPVMSASGSSGALPHYVPTEESNRMLNDHPIYWADSGGHYFGGSTDNTLAMALGQPSSEHVTAHTLVLKGFIALATACFPRGTTGSQLDPLARQFLWQRGMDYAHGTGHGVGNFLNIHENLKLSRFGDVAFKEGMVLSNEPAYYAEGDFGIRIESHMVVVPSKYEGYLEFETLSRLPIDPRLVNVDLLSQSDKRWLSQYHQKIARDYTNELDQQTANWLANLVSFYTSFD